MMIKANQKIDNFIENLEENKKKIVITLRKLVSAIAPKAKEEIKWGGIVFFATLHFME